jgi:hypothetical protein
MQKKIAQFFKFALAGKNVCKVKFTRVRGWVYLFHSIWECESHYVDFTGTSSSQVSDGEEEDLELFGPLVQIKELLYYCVRYAV